MQANLLSKSRPQGAYLAPHRYRFHINGTKDTEDPRSVLSLFPFVSSQFSWIPRRPCRFWLPDLLPLLRCLETVNYPWPSAFGQFAALLLRYTPRTLGTLSCDLFSSPRIRCCRADHLALPPRTRRKLSASARLPNHFYSPVENFWSIFRSVFSNSRPSRCTYVFLTEFEGRGEKLGGNIYRCFEIVIN